MLPIVAALVRAGHEVRVYTGKAYQDGVHPAVAIWLGWEHALDFDEFNLAATFPASAGSKGPRSLHAVDPPAPQFLQPNQARRRPAALTHPARHGLVLTGTDLCPWHSGNGLSPAGVPGAHPLCGDSAQDHRGELGPTAVVGRGADCPAAAGPHHPGDAKRWPSRADPASLGRPGPLDVQAVAVTGRAGHTDVGLPLAGNAHVTDLIPYEALLPHVSLMITNGGWGGVLAALSHGVPLIVTGRDIDKPEIAARVAYSGAGIDLRTGTPTVARLARAIAAIMADPRHAARAAELATLAQCLVGAERNCAAP
ncbi:nucleotide disphospho-sugar-binding domain-containing protein [Specibacter sp. NPDC078692]|uniref:glycosyltransferase n=1 Tax=Specibacter sp. NPDC078692 TaxID=3155818 RepID=UPI00342371F3